jgi:EAL domain-containing protein (putative c-di-GMP-specific phosphodiesterase class I)
MIRTTTSGGAPGARPASDTGPAASATSVPHELDGDITTELRRALDDAELRLHYQPLVDPRTGEIVGAEALLRWAHPDRGVLAPGTFLEAADASALSLELAEWVAGEAIAEAARWPDTWHVSINLSPRQVLLGGSRGLRETLAWLCRVHGVAPARLCIELTEQDSLDSDTLLALLDSLSDLGIRVAVDDFGDGSASLGRLRKLPFDIAKIDRSLVTDIHEPAALMTLRLAIDLGRACTSRVIIEGVETAEQLDVLRRLDCDLVQGYHLARPMPAEELRALAGTLLHPPADGDHAVVLYDDETELAERVVGFLASGLCRGASAVVVARPGSVAAVAAGLATAGFDPAELRAGRRLVELDAATTLTGLSTDGELDVTAGEQLAATLGEMLAPTTGPVRVFGEIGPLLLAAGRMHEAVTFERYLHELRAPFPFTLLCAYPTAMFSGTRGTDAFHLLLRDCHDRAAPSAAAQRAACEDLASPALLHQELAVVRANSQQLARRVLD